MPIGNGGIIGPANVPTLTTASGVWSLREQQQAQGRGAWPLAIAPDPYFEYTTLLLPGNGTDGKNNNAFLDSGTANSGSGFPITRNGNTTQGTFSPFSQTGWGNYFDGSGDQLTVANNSAFDFGSGNFTVEAWCYFTGSTGSVINYSNGQTSNLNFAWEIYQTSATSISMSIVQSSTSYSASSTALVANAWNHVAGVRNGNTLTIYVNGVAGGTTANVTGVTANNPGSATVKISGYNNATNCITGYVSNARIVKGTAVYTGNFTPPTSPLTAISGTSLLTCQSNRFIDNSTNNFTITRNGDTSVVAFSPFNPTLPWSSATNGGSGYFDGNGDYLQTPNNAAFNLSSGSFTIEAWVYRTNPTTSDYVFWSGTATGSNSGLNFYISGGNLLYIDNGVTGTTGYGSVTGNQWIHVALIRDGGNSYLYVNGVCANPSTPVTQAIGTGGIGLIGCAGVTTQGNFDGYISNFRIIKGQALVTGGANFTPPTGPVNATQVGWNGSTTALTGTCSLLLNYTNAGIYDATGKNNIETVNDARISTAITPKWGNGSILLEPSVGSTQDYLLSSAPLSELAFLNNGSPWTVEGWFYTGSTSQQTILSTNAATATIGITIDINSSTTRDLACYIYRGVSGSFHATVSSGSVWSLSTWTYFAVVLDASKNLTVYINGSQVATTSASSFSFSSSNPTYPLVIGRYQFSTPGGYFNGYLQDIRITRGIARTITTPTTAFPTL